MLCMFCPHVSEFSLHSLAIKMRFYCYQHFQIISELMAVVACRKKKLKVSELSFGLCCNQGYLQLGAEGEGCG